MTNEQKVKAAAELIRSYDRLQNIKDELSNYDLLALQKSAAVGHDKETRIKVAALVRQHEIEKQAFLKAFSSLNKQAFTYAGVPGVVRNAQKLMNNPGLSAGTNAIGKAVGAGAAGAGLGGLLGAGAAGAAGAGRNLMQQVPGIAKAVGRNAATGLGAGTNAFGRQALGGLGGLLGAGAGAGAAGLAAGGALGSRLGQQIGRLGQQLPGLGGFSPSGINPNAPTPRINLPSQAPFVRKPQLGPMESLRRSGFQDNTPLPARNAPLPAPRGFGYGVTNNPLAAGLGQ